MPKSPSSWRPQASLSDIPGYETHYPEDPYLNQSLEDVEDRLVQRVMSGDHEDDGQYSHPSWVFYLPRLCPRGWTYCTRPQPSYSSWAHRRATCSHILEKFAPLTLPSAPFFFRTRPRPTL